MLYKKLVYIKKVATQSYFVPPTEMSDCIMSAVATAYMRTAIKNQQTKGDL